MVEDNKKSSQDEKMLTASEIAEIVAEIEGAKTKGKFEAKGLDIYLEIRTKHHEHFQSLGKHFDDLATLSKEVLAAQGRGDKAKALGLEERARMKADSVISKAAQIEQILKDDAIIRQSTSRGGDGNLGSLVIEVYAAGRKSVPLRQDEEVILHQFKEQAWKRRKEKKKTHAHDTQDTSANLTVPSAKQVPPTRSGPGL